MLRRLLCRLGAHRWERRRNADGEQYRACPRCGKDGDYAGVDSVLRAGWWT